MLAGPAKADSKGRKGHAVGNRLARTVLVAGLLASVLFLASRLRDFYWPGNQQDYEPVQPIALGQCAAACKIA